MRSPRSVVGCWLLVVSGRLWPGFDERNLPTSAGGRGGDDRMPETGEEVQAILPGGAVEQKVGVTLEHGHWRMLRRIEAREFLLRFFESDWARDACAPGAHDPAIF